MDQRVRIRDKKCSLFGKLGVLCFIVTSVLRVALLPYYQRLDKIMSLSAIQMEWNANGLHLRALGNFRNLKRTQKNNEKLKIIRNEIIHITKKIFESHTKRNSNCIPFKRLLNLEGKHVILLLGILLFIYFGQLFLMLKVNFLLRKIFHGNLNEAFSSNRTASFRFP